jgi:hypothetical protein
MDMISNPTSAHKYMTVYYTHCVSPTCCGHSYGHLQGDAFQRQVHRNVSEEFETMNRYKISNFKNNK